VAGPPQPAEREAILRFREAYPDIALKYVGLLGQDYLHRVETERSTGIYSWDAFIDGVSTQYDYIPKGYFQPIKPNIILPEVRDDKSWIGGFDAGFTDVGKQYVYAFTQYVTTLIKVNRTLVPRASSARLRGCSIRAGAGRSLSTTRTRAAPGCSRSRRCGRSSAMTRCARSWSTSSRCSAQTSGSSPSGSCVGAIPSASAW
jgi:hypothetical protein